MIVYTFVTMGIVFRQSAKTSLIVLSGAVLGVVILWLTTKYVPDKHQFGFLQTITNYAITTAQVLLFGLNWTLAVNIHKYDDDAARRKVLLTICFGLPAVLLAFVSIVYFVAKAWVLKHYQPDDIPLMQQYYGWVPVYILLFIYQLIFEQYLGAQMKVAIAAFIREVVIRIANILIIMLFAFGYLDFSGLVISTVLMYLITAVAFALLSARTKAFGLSLNFNAFTKDEYREMAKFTWYHFLLNLVILLMSTLDALALPFYDNSGFAAVAIYRIPVFMIVVLQLPVKALMPATFTTLARAFADNDSHKARDIFMRASINMLIPTLAMAVLLCCNLGNIQAVIPNGYAAAIPVFLILLLSKLVDCATGMNDAVLSITNHYKFNFYLSLILTVMLFVLLRTLIPRYGIYGAAWATTGTLIFFNVCKYAYVWKKLNLQPFSRNTVMVIIAALPALAAGYFFPHLLDQSRHVYVRTFADASMRSIAAMVVYLGMLLWLQPSDDLRTYLASIKEKKRLF